jgi:hypothetical protein
MTSWARSFIVVVGFVAGCAGTEASSHDAPPSRADGGVLIADGATNQTGDAGRPADDGPPPDAGMGITKVAVDISADNQVRQGAGPVTLTVTGTGLGGVTSAKLGTIAAVVTSASDANVTLSASIPHGCPLGALTVSLATPSGTVTSSETVNITAISAAAGVGDDAALGTPDSPFATLTRALGVAGSGDTIKLADGAYSAGESWPEGFPASTSNVPDGVTVQGTSLANTILVPASNAAPDVVGLVFAGSAQVSNLQIQGFERGAIATGSGAVGLSNVHIHGNSIDGVYASGSVSVLIGSAELDTNGSAGVHLAGNASGALDSVSAHGNATGAYLEGNSQMQALLGTTFIGNGHVVSATNSGVFITGTASAKLVATAGGNVAAGVYSESTGALSLEGTYSGNGTSSVCGANPLCSGIVLFGGQTVQLQGDASNNHVYGVVSKAMHPVITMTGMNLDNNGLANASFTDEVSPIASYTLVTITNTTMSNSITGIVWSDGVTLSMTGGWMYAHSAVDISNQVAVAGLGNSFNDVEFGSSAQVFPVIPSVTETASGAVANGPSWSIGTPGALGATVTFTTTLPPRQVQR